MDNQVDNPTEGTVTTGSESTPSPVVRYLIPFPYITLSINAHHRRPWIGTTWTGASLANMKHTGVA